VLGDLSEAADAQARRPCDGAGVAFFREEGQAEKGGLAAAVGAHQADALAGMNLEGDLVEDRERSECFRDLVKLQQHRALGGAGGGAPRLYAAASAGADSLRISRARSS